MSPRRQSRTYAGRGFRPAGEWTGLNSTAQSTVAASTKVLLGDLQVSQPMTLRRIRGVCHIVSDQLATTEHAIGAFGACVVSEDANAVGATAVPGPVSDIGSELWVMYQPLISQVFVNTAVGFDARAGMTFDIDSKGQRKVTGDERVAFVVENASSSFGFLFSFFIRAFFTETSRG